MPNQGVFAAAKSRSTCQLPSAFLVANVIDPLALHVESSPTTFTESALVNRSTPSLTDSICTGNAPQFFPRLESQNCQMAPVFAARVDTVRSDRREFF